MSNEQAIQALKLMDNIDKTNDTILKTQFKVFTDYEYNESLKDELYKIINKNDNNTGIFVKLSGLITFQNVILVSMIGVAIIFLVSLFKDIMIALGAFIAYFIIQIILDKRFIYCTCLLSSSITMYFKPDQIENQYIKYIFIFDWLTPLFGCIIFSIVSFMIYNDLITDNLFGNFDISNAKGKTRQTRHGGYDKENSHVPIGIFVTMIWILMTVYHENWLIGVGSVMMLFFTFGFLFGSMFGGYYIGFTDDNSIERCFYVSLILNALMISIKSGSIINNLVGYAFLFETGIFFWGSLIGNLAMLIMSDEYYVMGKKKNDVSFFLFMQILMGIYSLGMMYVGSILNIANYKSIGGTFLVLWGLDLEKSVLQKLGTGHATIALGIIFVNLYIIKQLISWYPEYCIF